MTEKSTLCSFKQEGDKKIFKKNTKVPSTEKEVVAFTDF